MPQLYASARPRAFPTRKERRKDQAGSFASSTAPAFPASAGRGFRRTFLVRPLAIANAMMLEKRDNSGIRKADRVSALSGYSARIYRKTTRQISFFNIID
jgi:hypothetical protein